MSSWDNDMIKFVKYHIKIQTLKIRNLTQFSEFGKTLGVTSKLKQVLYTKNRRLPSDRDYRPSFVLRTSHFFDENMENSKIHHPYIGKIWYSKFDIWVHFRVAWTALNASWLVLVRHAAPQLLSLHLVLRLPASLALSGACRITRLLPLRGEARPFVSEDLSMSCSSCHGVFVERSVNFKFDAPNLSTKKSFCEVGKKEGEPCHNWEVCEEVLVKENQGFETETFHINLQNVELVKRRNGDGNLDLMDNSGCGWNLLTVACF